MEDALSMERLSSESSIYLAIKTTQFSQCTNKGFLLHVILSTSPAACF
jgi:hypothetical protein